MRPLIFLLLPLFVRGLVVPSCPRKQFRRLAKESDDEIRTLPLDFGSRGAEWRLEWIDSSDNSQNDWDARDVLTGSVLFLTCHINALVVAGESGALSRCLGIGSFALAQTLAESPYVPLRRGLSLSDLADKFQWTQQINVSQVGNIAWPLVSLGASVPVFQAVLVPLFLSGELVALTQPPPTPNPELVLLVPFCEEIFFRLWFLDAARRANFPYIPSILASGLAFGLWHGLQPTSIGLAVLGVYWAHLYAQTNNVLVPIGMHILWNTFATYEKAFTTTS